MSRRAAGALLNAVSLDAVTPNPSLPAIAAVGPLYTGTERGLAAGFAAARALGLEAHPVCTALIAASRGTVSDVVEVPVDTVRAQFEHLAGTVALAGVAVGALLRGRTAGPVIQACETLGVPTVLDFVISGPSGETLLDKAGTDLMTASLDRFSLVTVSRTDAELITDGEIRSLDDAQVAVQRLSKRGARRVVIRCGQLPARFFEAEDPGAPIGDGSPALFDCDLYYDGEDFTLYEAPHIGDTPAEGASDSFVLAILASLIAGRGAEEAVQHAKRFVTESIRAAVPSSSGRRLSYRWQPPT